MKRYQHCSWSEKLWRRRHQLSIPYWAIKYRLLNHDYSWDLAWAVACGEADFAMGWWYYGHEIDD